MTHTATTAGSGGMHVIDADAIRRLTPMPALVETLRRAFADDIRAPDRTVHAMSASASLLLMPAWRDGGRAGIKIVNVDTARRPAVHASYVLSNAAGQVEAVLDGAMLTARRTAAASALAADCLARADARTLLMIGTGTLAPHLVEAHMSVRGIERVLVWGRTTKNVATLVTQLRARGIDAVRAERLADGLQQADVISAATTAGTALVEGRYLSPGAHVDLVGAFRRDMREADPEAFARALVYVDTHAGALAEAGDLLQALDAGVISAQDIRGSLTDLVRGAVPGRRDAAAITLFKSVGTALEDLACAELVVDALRREG